MGKITDFQKIQDSLDMSYMRNIKKQTKEKLKIKGIKDLSKLLLPGASNKYKLSKNQRNFQLRGRITIGAIATMLALGGGVATINHHQNIATNAEISDDGQTIFSKEELLDNAEEKLMDIVLGDSYKEHSIRSMNITTLEDGTKKLAICTKGVHPNSIPVEHFSYRKYISNIITSDADRNSNTEDEIKELLDSIIVIYFSENPSQNDLEILNTKISNLDPTKYELVNNEIVDKTRENNGMELTD